MNERDATQWFLLSVAVALTTGSVIAFASGNMAATFIQSSTASVITRFIGGDEDSEDEDDKAGLARTYKILAKSSPEALEAWMNSLSDEEVEYIYDRAITHERTL